jgi:hypothetical protein
VVIAAKGEDAERVVQAHSEKSWKGEQRREIRLHPAAMDRSRLEEFLIRVVEDSPPRISVLRILG